MGELSSAKKLRRLIVYRPALDRGLCQIVKVNRINSFAHSRLEGCQQGASLLKSPPKPH